MCRSYGRRRWGASWRSSLLAKGRRRGEKPWERLRRLSDDRGQARPPVSTVRGPRYTCARSATPLEQNP